ncbi:MAG: HPr family phosphocarrier protein, partial [Lentisphaerae bacterium]
VQNAHGIHCRPSAVIVTELAKVDAQVEVEYDGMRVDLSSPLNLIGLGLPCGAQVKIIADGPQEEEALQIAVELFERHFDFPPREG